MRPQQTSQTTFDQPWGAQQDPTFEKTNLLPGGILIFLFALSILVYTPKVAAGPTTCQGLVQELRAMKQAQNQIITSLAQNHETFATQLSDLSFELALYKKNVPQKALVAMEKSAQAYRGRSEKAFQTAEKLESSTEDLIRRIQSCLK